MPRHVDAASLQPARLVLLRHGESNANAARRFTGAWDVPLSEHGRGQSRWAAGLLDQAGVVPGLILTPPLRRATETAEIVRRELQLDRVLLRVCPPLTERAYGVLTGQLKAHVSHTFGASRALRWRRSLNERPPRRGEVAGIASGPGPAALVSAQTDAWAAEVPPAALAASEASESLADVVTWVRAWHNSTLLPRLAAGAVVLVVAHGNSLRALAAILDQLDAAAIEKLNIPTGEPLLYRVRDQGSPLPGTGRYLSPTTAHAAAAAVADEGGT